MRNLKRALSLVMAMALIVGMMVVSASAVSKDFTDKDEIDHNEAVNTMVALNVIAGKEDGSYFDPTGSLTRAEMAKVVSYVMNGGVEPNIGTKLVPTYSDIKGHWAEKYIEYCTSMGIIAGDGAGKFNPEGTLTAEQAAKMFLTAMGYNANVFGFTGNDWAMNVGRYANETGLYKELGSITASAVISRDDACQMAYNAIQATMMKRSWSQDLTTGQLTETYVPWVDDTTNIPHTLLLDKFNARVYEGVLGSTGEYGTALATMRDGFRVNVEKINGKTVDNNTTPGAPVPYAFEYEDQDLSALMGQYVKVIYADNTDTCYGVYAVADKNTLLETSVNATDYTNLTHQVKVDGVIYDLEDTIVYYYGESRSTSNANATQEFKADKIVYIDNDGNGKFDLALITPVNVAEVTFLSDTNVTLSLQGNTGNFNPKALTQRLVDVNAPEDLAKGDFVLVYRDYYSDKDTFEVLEKQSGTVTGVRGSAAPYDEYLVDGTWYKLGAGYEASGKMPTTIKSGSTIDFVSYNGRIFYAKMTSGAQGSEDLAMIYQLSYGAGGTFDAGTLSAKIILADGTKTTVTVGALYADGVAEAAGTSVTLASPVDGDEQAYLGQLLSYTVNNDGEYEFTKLHNTNNKVGYDTVTGNVGTNGIVDVNGSNQIAGTVVADDANILVIGWGGSGGTQNTNNNATMISGKEFKSLDLVNGYGTSGSSAKINSSYGSAVIGKDADGFNRVQVAVVTATTYGGGAPGFNPSEGEFNLGTFTGSNYGYLVANPWTTTIEGEKYNGYTLWTGGPENVTVYEKSNTASSAAVRDIIGYDVVEDDVIKNVKVVTSVGAVTAFNDSTISISTGVGTPTEYDRTNNTVVLNVDDANHAGVEGDAISVARSLGSTDNYYNNARYYVNSNGEVEVIVIDTARNELAGVVPALAPVASGTNVNTLPTITPTGEGVIAPVATITANPTFGSMYSGDFAGGVEGNLTSKYTAMAINVPVGTAATNVAIKLNNSALIAFTADGRVNAAGTEKYSGIASLTETDGYLELSFIVQNDGQPITLEVLVGSEVQSDYATGSGAYATNQGKWATDSAKSGVEHYTYTIVTTGIEFQ